MTSFFKKKGSKNNSKNSKNSNEDNSDYSATNTGPNNSGEGGESGQQSPSSDFTLYSCEVYLSRWDLEQYTDALKNDGFDHVDEWFTLTTSDLVAMGFKKGHRRRFLRLIADLLSERNMNDRLKRLEQQNVNNNSNDNDNNNNGGSALEELVIFGAAYGTKDVTAIVRSKLRLRSQSQSVNDHNNSNAFTIGANNQTFGDPWPGTRKSLVVVSGFVRIRRNTATSSTSSTTSAVTQELIGLQTSVAQEGDMLRIGGGSSNPMEMMRVQNENQSAKGLNILGACYGLADCTQKAQSLVAGDGGGGGKSICASNSVFGDSWHGIEKTLVVVYIRGCLSPLEYTRGVKVAIAREHQNVQI